MSKVDDKDLKKVAGGGPGTNLQDLYAATNYGDSGATNRQGALIQDEPPAADTNEDVDHT